MRYFQTQTEIRAIEQGQEFLIQSDWVELTQEELEAKLAPTPEQIAEAKISEANAYLTSSDWIEAYKLRHDLGLEIIPETSSKREVINKRDEYKEFLRNNQ